MVRSVISAMSTGRLEIVKGNLNKVGHCDIIEWFPYNDCTFMHDGAPCKTVKTVKTYLDKHGIRVHD